MVRRGDVVIAALTGEAGHKPRPAVIMQDDAVAETATVMVVPVTSDIDDRLVLRPLVQPDAMDGLRVPSGLIIDRMRLALRSSMRDTVGRISDNDLEQLERAIFALLGMARSWERQ
jgi:mRNA interferase MazF